MRRKMRLDCTGEPPGELITTATDGARERLKAFSIGTGERREGNAGPERRGHADGPDSLKTGTTVPRENGHMRVSFIARERPSSETDRSLLALVQCRQFLTPFQ